MAKNKAEAVKALHRQISQILFSQNEGPLFQREDLRQVAEEFLSEEEPFLTPRDREGSYSTLRRIEKVIERSINN